MTKLMIYGATGYAGRMAAEYARKSKLNFIVAGRAESKVNALATSMNTGFRVFSVDDNSAITASLEGVEILLNCAGPFMRTAEPLMLACIEAGVHYLDIAAELDSYRLAEKHDERARGKGVMLLPGCGGSVAMLGCLTAHLLGADVVRKPVGIEVALHVSGSMSRGSAISATENLTAECLQRCDGKLEGQDPSMTARLDFDNGNGAVGCSPVTLPDLITIWRATGIPNIRTFVHASGDAFPTGDLSVIPEGPSAEEREATPYDAAVVVTAEDGSKARAVLHTVNGYTLTPVAAIEAVRRVLAGDVQGGFQTPAGLFGADFILSVEGSRFIDI